MSVSFLLLLEVLKDSWESVLERLGSLEEVASHPDWEADGICQAPVCGRYLVGGIGKNSSMPPHHPPCPGSHPLGPPILA